MKELLDICDAFKDAATERCALATVIGVEGSAYRRPGARMLLTPEGKSWGMISGGCLEHDVFDQARRALQSGSPRLVRYDSTSDDDIVFGTGLGCNGIIDVLVEPVTDAFRESFSEMIENCRRTRQPGAIATLIQKSADGQSEPALKTDHAFLSSGDWIGDSRLISLLSRSPLDANGFDHLGQATLLSEDIVHGNRVFFQPILPPIQLVAFGGWLDVAPLVRIAREVGFQVIVVDSVRRESSKRFFPEADSVLLCSPAEALSQIRFDERTVAVLMNHHFERDQEALAALAALDGLAPPYVGMLGPKRRQQRLLEAVKAGGVPISESLLHSLHGPAGLDLGAKTPGEIALSILAEILSALNDGNAKPLRDRQSAQQIPQPALVYA